MKDKYRQEINEIAHELAAVIRELDHLSYDIEKEFKGVGSAYCAKGIRDLSGRYRRVRNELNQI